MMVLSAVFYYKSVNYSAPDRVTVSFDISDRPFATDSGQAEKKRFLNSAENDMLKLGLAEDYRFWLDRVGEARKTGNKEKEKQAKASLKSLLSKIMKLPEADIKFVQEQIGGHSLVLP